MAMSPERARQAQLQSYAEQYNQNLWIARGGTAVTVTSEVGVGIVLAKYFGILDAVGRFIKDIGIPWITQHASVLVPGFIGILGAVAGIAIGNYGRRGMAEAAAGMQALSAPEHA